MYDDVNEFFWWRENVDKLLPLGDGADKQSQSGLNPTLAYEALRSKFREAAYEDPMDPSKPRKDGFNGYFKKTFIELVSVPTVLYIYSRVLIIHSWAWHLLLALGFHDEWEWKVICIPTLTHSVLKLLQQWHEMGIDAQ